MVEDTGIGIDPQHHEMIFREFAQVDSSRARRHHGTGLGLAIARNFIQLHGGEIWVESALGEGSRFFFTLPAAGESAAAHGAMSGEHRRRPCILLVEDNETIRHAFAILLEDSGYDVLQAGSGAEALEIATREHPDLVLMDLGLPDINGLEVTRRLKAEPRDPRRGGRRAHRHARWRRTRPPASPPAAAGTWPSRWIPAVLEKIPGF